jgi:preprotein translocase subunit SecA
LAHSEETKKVDWTSKEKWRRLLFLRLTSVMTLTVWMVTTVCQRTSYADSPSFSQTGNVAVAPSVQMPPLEPASIEVPDQIGKIEDRYRGANGQTVILIQDAHAVPDAQRNIHKLIDYFRTQYGVDTVAVEGSSSVMDPQIFRSFPDQELLKKVFEKYFEEGELNGTVAAAIFSPKSPASFGQEEVRFVGIENWNLYEEGVEDYLQALEQVPQLGIKLKEKREKLKREKEKIYSPSLLEIDRLLESVRSDTAPLEDVLRKLSGLRPPDPGTDLALMMEEWTAPGKTARRPLGGPATDPSSHPFSVEQEVMRIARLVRQQLILKGVNGNRRLAILNTKCQEYQTSQLAPEAFALFLKELIAEEKLTVKMSNTLGSQVVRQKRLRDIEGTKFFREFERYAQSVKESLFRNDEERRLDRQTRCLALLERFAALELSREEWTQINGGRKKVESAGRNSRDVFMMFRDHFAFYENAIRRETALFGNLIKLFTPSTLNSAPSTSARPIFVAGGFHSHGMTRLLRGKGISYVLVRPQINSLPEDNHYRAQMRGEVSWGKYFQVENGKINLYEAFVRGTRDRLLAVKNEKLKMKNEDDDGESSNAALRHENGSLDFSLLKTWRDQLLFDLARARHIERAGNYTKFIDEVVTRETADELRPAWVAKIERFIESLRNLDAAGKVTEQNVLNLLQAATITTEVTANALSPHAASRVLARVRTLPSRTAESDDNKYPGREFVPGSPGKRVEIRGDILGPPAPSEKDVQRGGHRSPSVFLGVIWDLISRFFDVILKWVESSLRNLFGSGNQRYLKRLQPKLSAIKDGDLKSKFRAMSDAELKQETEKFKERLGKGESLDDLQVEAFALCREAAFRFLDKDYYDSQLIGGMVLHSGAIAEMPTGEGKTLVATLAAYLNALEGKGVHVVTVNDYLAKRDMERMAPLYVGLGLSVGVLQNGMGAAERQQAYSCDITYGTANEFGFDYLRDNMRPAARGDDRYPKHEQQMQRPLNFVIIDEIDSILIDEARTPLIISGPVDNVVRKYSEADQIARQLKRDLHYVVNEKDRTAHLTDAGVLEAERLARVESFYTAGNETWVHPIDTALKAHALFRIDVDYVVNGEGRIVIVDESTGRLMEGRQWSDGLSQAVEAKEKVKIKGERQTMATITLQNFFKLYPKIAGMTGTAMTEANEFWKIYKLDVIAIPPNRPINRKEYPDIIYLSKRDKFYAVADEVETMHRYDVITTMDGSTVKGTIIEERDSDLTFRAIESQGSAVISRDNIKEIQRRGRPILIGTKTIEDSEGLSELLNKRGIKHEVLNANNHTREAEIIAQAGRQGAVTVATNMAGRGTDIILGGNPETMAWVRLRDKYKTQLDVPRAEWDALVAQIDRAEGLTQEGERVKQLGGLHVIGTERHDARRIDRQLRGRSGRQGDPGSSRFYLSLEDDLIRRFAGDGLRTILETLGMAEGDSIESAMVTGRIEAAQRKVEERDFETRKDVLEYDEVMDRQRKRIYEYRQRILDGTSYRALILELIRQQIDYYLGIYMDPDFGVEKFARWAGERLGADLEARDFLGLIFKDAVLHARDEAQKLVDAQVFHAIEENLPLSLEGEEDQAGWNWRALTEMVNKRWHLNLQDRDLREAGRAGAEKLLIEKIREAIDRAKLNEGEAFLQRDFGVRSAIGWVQEHFDIELPFEEVRKLDASELVDIVYDRIVKAYEEKEAEYPVMEALHRFGPNIDQSRAALINWASTRFSAPLATDSFNGLQLKEIHAALLPLSRESQVRARRLLDEVREKVAEVFPAKGSSEGALSSLIDWMNSTFHSNLHEEELLQLNRDELERKLSGVVEDLYQPEMRLMQRARLLQIVDDAWKKHLLAMDHLRNSIGLVGYAQMDALIEFKREGLHLFEQMLKSMGERVTGLAFENPKFTGLLSGTNRFARRGRFSAAPTSSSKLTRQELRLMNYNIVASLTGSHWPRGGNEMLAREVVRRGVPKVIRDLQSMLWFVLLCRQKRVFRQASDHVTDIRSIAVPTVVEYQPSAEDRKDREALTRLVKVVRDAAAVNKFIVGRITGPKPFIRQLERLYMSLGHHKTDWVHYEIRDGEMVIYHSELPDKRALGKPASVTVTSSVLAEIQGMVLASDGYVEGQGRPAADLLYAAALILAAEALSLKTVESLEQYETGKFRPRSEDALNRLTRAVQGMIARQRAELRMAQAA